MEIETAGIDHLNKDVQLLLESVDKINERLNGMGRSMVDNTNKLAAKIEDNIRARLYMLHDTQSQEIGQISESLAKVQMFIAGRGDSSNRGKFSSIADMAEIKPFLEKEGLAITYHLGMNEYGEYTLKQLLSHSSKEWMSTIVLLHEETALSPQEGLLKKVGAAEKQLRRYMLRALLNFGEDDGE